MSKDHTVYLDYAATTLLDSRVLAAMMPYLTTEYGNASSIYALGRRALEAIDQARKTVADIIGCRASEITFVGCGSESDNLAIKGIVLGEQCRGKQILTTPIEHHAVLHACRALERFGVETSYLPVDRYGRVDPEDVARSLSERTALVSVMYANNEVGTIEPIAEIGAICRERRIPFHVDAVQAAGALPLDVEALNCDLLSLSAHKFYGPKGLGILYARQKVRLLSQLHGGAQERGRRAGTENVAGIVGAATALLLAQGELLPSTQDIRALRDRLISRILAAVPYSVLTGHPTERLPNSASFCFQGVDGDAILMQLDQHGVAASTGSACTSGSVEPSHVLVALGFSPDWVHGSLRLTLGKETREADIDVVLLVLPKIIERIRKLGAI